MHRRLFIGTIASMICLTMLSVGASEQLSHKGHGKQGAKQVLDNIGFMKNPPRELKERFPMCDAFLKVNWIDKQKKIGYSRYDLYKNGKKNGQMTALVYLSRHYPHCDYDLYDYKRDGRLEDIFSFIKEGRIVGGESLLTIRKGNRKITFFPHTPEETTFSDNRQNVCVLYPDNQLVWIVESSQVEKILTDQQIKERHEKIQRSSLDLTISVFKEMKVIDLNHDGCDDYYRYFPWFSYSYLDQYFQIGKSGAGFNYIESVVSGKTN